MPAAVELSAVLASTPRLEALRSTGLLDSAADPVFDRFTSLVCAALDVPVSVFSLVDDRRQFFKSARGLPQPWAAARQTPLSHCFCQYAVYTREPLIVGDARDHDWVCTNGAIADLGVIAYLGVPVLFMGKAIGTLAAIDGAARVWTDQELEVLKQLAILLQRELQHRDVHAEVAQSAHDLEEKNRALLAMQRAFAASEKRIRLIADNMPALICYIDRERRYQFVNATHAEWLRRPLEELRGKTLVEVHGEEIYRQVRPYMDRAFGGRRTDFEYCVEYLGRRHHVRGTYVPDTDDSGLVVGIYGLTHDATTLKEVEQQLRQLAQFDSLTGVANRNLFNEVLLQAIARSERGGTRMAVVYLDLDHFKSINDAHGHRGGDRVLQEFARRLQQCVRASDLVARLAGDEFVLILESFDHPDAAATVAAKIIVAMAAPVVLGGRELSVSCSIGIALRQSGELDPEQILHRADEALYRAKAAGRGCYEISA